MSFPAQYHGTCGECHEHITPGQEIQSTLAGDYIHADCDAVAVRERKEEVCTKCWLIKPCGCDS